VTYYVEEFVERGGGRQDVQVDLVRWDKDTGSFDSNMTTLTRGQVIRSKAKRDIALPDFIVDYTGGTRRLSRLPDSDEVLPTEVLAVNDAGELVVRTERADDDAHAIIQTRTSQPDRDATEDTTGINTFDFSGGLAKPSN
jgi:hypothetical protein